MELWTIAGQGITRYVAAARLCAHSSIRLVEPSGFTVARWCSGDDVEIVRGQWISTSPDLRLVLDGSAMTLDVAAEEAIVEGLCRRWGVPVSRIGAVTTFARAAQPDGAHA